MINYNDNNVVNLGGKVASELKFSHETHEENFYEFYLEVKRMSGYSDILPVIISERLIDINSIQIGDTVKISGQFRSHNQENHGKSKVLLFVFAKRIEKIADESISSLNNATFIGYICKTPIYRETPLGREITDVILAVNITYNRSVYIPCILWGRNAKFCQTLEVGTMLKLSGRIQSRDYEKKLEDGTKITKTAYEVSISTLSSNVTEEN